MPGNSPGTGEFPAQMASYVENVSIWWCHHGTRKVDDNWQTYGWMIDDRWIEYFSKCTTEPRQIIVIAFTFKPFEIKPPQMTYCSSNLSHKSHNTQYPIMHYFVTEICTYVHISVTKWCIVEYGVGALWDFKVETTHNVSSQNMYSFKWTMAKWWDSNQVIKQYTDAQQILELNLQLPSVPEQKLANKSCMNFLIKNKI